MKRAILIILGVVLVLFGLPLVVGGSMLAALANREDASIGGRIGQVDSLGYAVVSDNLEVAADWPFGDTWDASLGVRSQDSEEPVFIGYGPASAVDAYLAGSPYTVVLTLGDNNDRDRDVQGSAAPEPPGEQDFWVAASAGPGLQEIPLSLEAGDYRFVAMNADATPGVSLAVYGSTNLPFLFPLGIGMAVGGGALVLLGVVLLVLGIRAKASGPPQHAGAYPEGPPAGGGPYPPGPYPPGPYPPGPYPTGPPPTGAPVPPPVQQPEPTWPPPDGTDQDATPR